MATLDQLLAQDAAPEDDHPSDVFDINEWAAKLDIDLSTFAKAIEEIEPFLSIADVPFYNTIDSFDYKVPFPVVMSGSLYVNDTFLGEITDATLTMYGTGGGYA